MSVFHAQHDKDHPYTKVLNKLIQDERISYRSKGIMVYALSKPHEWTVRVVDISNHGTEGRLAVQKAMQELVRFGYARLQVMKDDNGKITGKDYWIYENSLASP